MILSEAGLDRLACELLVEEHPAVRDRDNLLVAEVVRELHEADELRVNRRLAAGQERPLQTLVGALLELGTDAFGIHVRPVPEHRVAAERADVVAGARELEKNLILNEEKEEQVLVLLRAALLRDRQRMRRKALGRMLARAHLPLEG